MWIWLILLAMIFWTASNFIDKYALEKCFKDQSDARFFYAFGNILTVIILFLFFNIQELPPMAKSLAILSGFALNIAYAFYFMALKEEDTSRVVPLFEFASVFSLIFGYLILKESLSPIYFIAFIFLFLGGWVLALEEFNLKIFKLRKVLFLMLASSFLIGIIPVIFKKLNVESDFFSIFFWEQIGFIIGAFSVILFKQSRKNIQTTFQNFSLKHSSIIFLNILVDIPAQILYRKALTFAPVAIISAVMGGHSFVVLITGIILTKFFPKIISENISKEMLKQKLIGVFSIIIGVLIIALN